MKTVHIIIPVFNRIEKTKLCITSVRNQTYNNIKIYLVDDGSTDGTSEIISNLFPDVIIIRGNGDLWWTGAIRKGVDYLIDNDVKDEDYVMTLNNDVILDQTTIEKLVSFTSDQKLIVNALSIDDRDKNTIISSGNKMMSWFFNISWHPMHGKKYDSLIDKIPVSVDILTGRSMLFSLGVCKFVGNFDCINFRHYAGDSEFSSRAKRKGVELFILPDAVCYVDKLATGLNPNTISKLSFKEKIQSLNSMKSTNNLKIRTLFVLKCCPWYSVPTCLLVTYMKIFTLMFITPSREKYRNLLNVPKKNNQS